MILGIGNELIVFGQAVLAGNLVCLIYQVLRVLRRLVPHNLLWISVEDILFWISAGFYLFYQIYRNCNGSIRWYFVIGALLGAILTYVIVDKIIKKYIA